jgi:hypothetical protein
VDYNTYVQQIATLAVVPQTDPNFQIILPQAISYAELRMQRELDFLSTQTSNSNYTLTVGSNSLSIPTSSFVTIQTINVVNGGQNYPLVPAAKQYLEYVWGSNTNAGIPKFFAVYGGDQASAGLTNQNFIVGPWPDQSYNLLITGTIRSQPLSSTNTSTFISTYLPDLFIAASMVYVSGYQRNFSASGADPQMPVNWEQQYQTLLKGATVEEFRKKFESVAWSSQSPSPVATPPRN